MRFLLMATSLLIATAAQADQGSAVTQDALPRWRSLDYLQQAFWVKASSSVRLERCSTGGAGARWCLSASNSVADNSELLQIETAADGSLVQRRRESVGRERRRVKEWHYDGDGIRRLRLEPANRSDPGQYVVTSERTLRYPPDVATVTDPLLLLALAAPQSGEQSRRQLVVHTDLNFYAIELTDAGMDTVAADYTLDGKRIDGQIEVTLVTVEAVPLEPLADKPDFSLLGLSGVVTIAFDQSGLPVQLRGRAPRLGQTEVNLQSAALRQNWP